MNLLLTKLKHTRIMKKFLLSALVALFMGLSANAQTVISNDYGSTTTSNPSNNPVNQTIEEDFQKWGFVGEIGYGFLDIDGGWAYKATIGASYSFTNNFYAQGQIGYNSSNINDRIKTGKYSSVGYDASLHFITIPLELGYRLTTKDRLWGVIPFAGIGFNIGLSGKSEYDDEKQKIKIGGKMGVEARAGLRLVLYGFKIIGSYHVPMNSKQEDFFGEDAYPELSIGFGI